MKITVSANGQITLPPQLVEQDAIRPGDEYELRRVSAGHYSLELTPARSTGLVEWLLACPEQDWFQPLDSE